MNTIEETIKLAGFGKRKMMQKQIELFEKDLAPGEELLGVVVSIPKPVEQFYLTNKRVITNKIQGAFSNERKEIPLSSISSVNMSTKGLAAEIEVVASNNKAFASNLPISVTQEVKKIIDSLIINN